MATITRDMVPVTNEVPPRMKGVYTLRVLKSEFGPAKKSQNPQLTLLCEIVDPKELNVDGKKYILDGMQHTYYIPIMIFKDNQLDPAKTQSAQDRFLQVLKVLGFPEEFDPENMNESKFDGLVFEAILDSIEDIHQKPNGKGGWEPITGADGKPISKGWRINSNNFAPAYDILRRSTMETNRGY